MVHPIHPASHRKSLAQLNDALTLLDHELVGLKLAEPIQIRAIGGYALLQHRIRTGVGALTVDIDTMTQDYAVGVQAAIQAVAEKLDLDPAWINNDNLGGNDPDEVAAMYDASWLDYTGDLATTNITLQVATIHTLTRSKIIAVDSLEDERAQDLPDLMALLAHQDITTVSQFQSRYPDPWDEFPNTASLVAQSLKQPEVASETLRQRAIKNSRDDFSQFTDDEPADEDEDSYDF